MDKNYEFEFEIYTTETGEKYLWISGNNGTGAEYPVNNFKEIGKAVTLYIEEYYSDCLK